MAQFAEDRQIRECVFCGGEPDVKTHEHVIPRWLISATGEPKRLIFVPVGAQTRRSFSFDKFVFPACRRCNNGFAQTEALAKRAIEKLWAKYPLTPKEAGGLLDWMDKVRVGLWLGGLMLSRNPLGIRPRFAISDRIARRDRLLYIGHTEEASQGLTFFHIADPMFMCWPCFGSLYANGLALVSLSDSGVAAKSLGLPHFSRFEVGWVNNEPTALSCTYERGNPANRGKGWPAPPSRFAILAQAIYDTDLCIADQSQEEDLRDFGIVPGTRSSVHVFKEGGLTALDGPAVDVLPRPARTAKELYDKHRILYLRLRRWGAKRLPSPVAGKPLYPIQMIKGVGKRRKRRRNKG